MFRKMIRVRQMLSIDDTIAVLNRCTNGVLACSGDESYPYAVPLNYVYHDHKIYFHCAKAGHKIDAITKNPKVSFAVVDQDTIVSEEYT
ncbi:MAG: pyridoxamine 5'-phosphate oxidase family protein, partial [Bacillota bacterium]|nr:pyridoxamine 5'-phosphate oxidase family protein [Bacillota bacterium]